jgi:ABC-type branched-subunit amino acid transport system substrate-binding protein
VPSPIPGRIARLLTSIRRGTALAAAAATLAAVSPARSTAAAAPPVLRIGYLAEAGGLGPPPADDPAAVSVPAYMGLLGARQSAAEADYTARLMGRRVRLLEAAAATPDEAVGAAGRLAALGATVLVGGFDFATAAALSRFARAHGRLFFNVGATDDRLRNEACDRDAFHVEAADAMYLDAAADWFIRGLAFLVDEDSPQGIRIVRRAPARAWFLVGEGTPAGRARLERLEAALESRHWGGRVAGRALVDAAGSFGGALQAVRRTRPDLVMLLVPAHQQLRFYREAEAARLAVEVTGLPEPATQTRAFFGALLRTAPAVARGSIRLVSWEPTFGAVGGPQLAERFFERWRRPMDGPAWTSWLAVKIVAEAAARAQTTAPGGLLRYLTSSGATFEGYQGVGMSFRPWDHQLRHPVMASRLTAYSADATAMAEMYGQFPNVVAPGRDPDQVLDQLGDTAASTRCRWR